MAVKKCKKHPDCYEIDWRPQGRKGPHPQRHFTGTHAEAVAFWQEMVRLSRKARHQVATFDPRVNDLLADWKAEYKNDHADNTIRDMDNAMVHLVAHFGKLHLSEICPPVIEQYKSARLAQKTPLQHRKGETDEQYNARLEASPRTITKRTINRDLAYFSSFLRWCLDHGHLETMPRIKRFPPKQTTPQDPVHPLHVSEVDAILEHVLERHRGLFLLMNDAGLRVTEATTLDASRVNLHYRMMIITGKGNKTEPVPIMTERLYKALALAVKDHPEGPLFPNPETGKPYTAITKRLITAAKKAGITDKRIHHHLLRHTFCTVAIASRMNPRTVQNIARHTSFATTEKYIHLAGEYHKEEAKKFQSYTENPTDTVSVTTTRQLRTRRGRTRHTP